MNGIKSNTFAEKAVEYFLSLKKPVNLPQGVEFLNPYENKSVRKVVKEFYRKFYNDNNKRVFIFGINPGRFGGGLTGISFTDPVALRLFCGIENRLGNRRELSSDFIYKVVEQFGGAGKFFRKYFLTALYPLAIIKDGKNHNYYDSKELYEIMKPLLIDSVREQIKFGAEKSFAVSLGKKNAKYLEEINTELNYFREIKVVEHPRFIMQYRRKRLHEFISKYLETIKFP